MTAHRHDAAPRPAELRARLDELQQNVEQIGREEPAPAPSGEHPNGPAAETAEASRSAAVALGPVPSLVDLRLLEEAIGAVQGIVGVEVRWVGRRWARLDVAMTGAAELGTALSALGRPFDLEAEDGGLLVVRFADVGGPPEPLPAAAMPPARSRDVDQIDLTAAQRLPETVCRYFHVVPIGFDGSAVTLAVADPADRLAQDVAAALTGAAVSAVPVADDRVTELIDVAFGEHEGGHPQRPLEETQRIADELGIPMIDLEGITPTAEALTVIPSDLQQRIPCLPLEIDDAVLYLATSAPLSDEDAERLGSHAGGRRLRAFLAPDDALEEASRSAHAEAEGPATLHSPPPTAFPGKKKRRKRRGLVALPLAVWAFLRAPVPIGVALVVVGVLVYLYLSV